ncbi:hypothetical protein Sa4125_00700 [Aureimonas sp. SA4125]|uniref:DUF2442 domain-containing protein n=1 Tax=Aureimonas sp. SA4125 TaxID=2826993 RepID=UPI001CC434FA|nr:DUF2442 domain-containing protein [Aureimonas sp. SA4125]BDA82528.1 hypothetical protein Sa4125_00700 [Aureimonas sp. SA4125]
MTILEVEIETIRPVEAVCRDGALRVRLLDGRELQAPLWWYPRLAGADPAALVAVELSPMGLHCPTLDEDISIASILRGQKAPGAVPPLPAPPTPSTGS